MFVKFFCVCGYSGVCFLGFVFDFVVVFVCVLFGFRVIYYTLIGDFLIVFLAGAQDFNSERYNKIWVIS